MCKNMKISFIKNNWLNVFGLFILSVNFADIFKPFLKQFLCF